MRRKFVRGCAPFFGVGVGDESHVTQCHFSQGLSTYRVACWCIQPFGQKMGAVVCFGGEDLYPHVAQCTWTDVHLHGKCYLYLCSHFVKIHMAWTKNCEEALPDFGGGNWVPM